MNKQILLEEQNHLNNTVKEIDEIINNLGEELNGNSTSDFILSTGQ